jgi:hypothetical protein
MDQTAMEAWEKEVAPVLRNAFEASGSDADLADRFIAYNRNAFLSAVRERLAQVFQVVALERGEPLP